MSEQERDCFRDHWTGSNKIMISIEAITVRRQILDWRDKWIEQIPVMLERELPTLLTQLNARIDKISWRETFSTGDYAQKHFHSVYESWIANHSNRIMARAQSDLEVINDQILEYNASVAHQVKHSDSSNNFTEAGIATGTASAAILGIPAVAAFSTTSAGGMLGLLGVTVISWPVVLGGAAILGSLAIFGGSKLARYKEKAIRELKEKSRTTAKITIFGKGGDRPSVATGLQEHIRTVSAAYLEKIANAR